MSSGATALQRSPSQAAGKRAPASCTTRVLRCLGAYLAGCSNRKQSTAQLLGCSERTAARLISRLTPYEGRLKMAWVRRVCAAVGKPVEDLVGKAAPRAYESALVSWSGEGDDTQALHDATDLGLAISKRAWLGFNLSGDFTVVNLRGRPVRVVVKLSPVPDMVALGGRAGYFKLVLEEDIDYGRVMLRCYTPTAGRPDWSGDEDLTMSNVEKHLRRIYELTKDFAP